MPKSSLLQTPAAVVTSLLALGALLRTARVARDQTAEQMAQRLNISRGTWVRMEQGDATVRIGAYFSALALFQMEERLYGLAGEDRVTKALQQRRLSKRATSTSGRPRAAKTPVLL
jgi:transcriptional regulator with XRE-family HTH domain